MYLCEICLETYQELYLFDDGYDPIWVCFCCLLDLEDVEDYYPSYYVYD